MTGRTVVNDSGNRRVRKRVDACLYILEIWDAPCREGVDLESEETEEDMNCDEDAESIDRLKVSVFVPLWAMMILDNCPLMVA
jgi:hypothetical protein